MTSSFKVGQLLKGKVSKYTITKQFRSAVWLALDGRDQPVVIKSAPKTRLENERDIIKRFQRQAPYLRPLIDEIHDPLDLDPPSIVLRHLDNSLLRASNLKKLNRREIKYAAKRVLETLQVLHADGYVHTDIKLDNILVNYGNGGPDVRFTDVQVSDCGDSSHVESPQATQGAIIGAGIFRSPEAMLNMPWGTATDIWSFGTTLISMIWGEDWHIFTPDVPVGDDMYELKILMRHHLFFGPFPLSYKEIADNETLGILAFVNNGVKAEDRKPFRFVSDGEITDEDKEFLLRIMKLDPRDRPSAKELLQDKWFEAE